MPLKTIAAGQVQSIAWSEECHIQPDLFIKGSASISPCFNKRNAEEYKRRHQLDMHDDRLRLTRHENHMNSQLVHVVEVTEFISTGSEDGVVQ